MPKTYTVGGAPAQVGMGGHRLIKIDSVAPNTGGNALFLNPNNVANTVHVPNAGLHAAVDFTTHDSIYTSGLAHCMAVCLAYNKMGTQFLNGHLAHISHPNAAALANAFGALVNPNLPIWAVVSVGAGMFPAMIANRLHATFGLPHNNIWIYIRAGSNTFGIDRYGNFGEF
jgi:hypothetical protein